MGFAYFEISRAFSGIIRDFLTHKTGFSDSQNWIFEPRAPQTSTSISISICNTTNEEYTIIKNFKKSLPTWRSRNPRFSVSFCVSDFWGI